MAKPVKPRAAPAIQGQVKRILLILSALAIAMVAVACFLRPRVTQDYEFPEGYLAGLKSFDDADWSAVLSAHVNGEGRVDYEALLKDREPLTRYLALIGAVGPTTRPELFPTREDKLAYWINAYNAIVIDQVLRRWPIQSVIDHKVSFFVLTRYDVDGAPISLYSLENDTIRKGFGDERIHFALNCGGRGCPRLPAVPFRGDTLEQQLQTETDFYLAERRNVSMAGGVAVEGHDLVLNEIFSWYSEDFKPDVKAWVAKRRPDLAIDADTKVRHRDYDWTLNGQ